MARLVRENELSTTKIYGISDYSSSLTAKCADYTYLSELSITSTATSAYVYTGGSSSSKIATYKQFKTQALTASTWNINCEVYFGKKNGSACEVIITGSDMGYNNLIGKYYVPQSISTSSNSSYQSSYPNEYRTRLLYTTTMHADFTLTSTLTYTSYGMMHSAGNTVSASSYIGGRIGTIQNTIKYCNISGTSKSAGTFYHIYNETGLYYNGNKNSICFGNYRTGEFSHTQIWNMYGYIYLLWLNSGSKMNSGPGLYWRVLDPGNGSEIYIKAEVENRSYNGTNVTLTGKLYMPVHVIVNQGT